MLDPCSWNFQGGIFVVYKKIKQFIIMVYTTSQLIHRNWINRMHLFAMPSGLHAIP